MNPTPVVNPAAAAPLFAPWEEPDKHRVRAAEGHPAEIKTYRRPSPNRLVDPLRALVKEWRESGYVGASGTTRALLNHWFGRPHRIMETDGAEAAFRYYFCQREAIETFVYLMEVRRLRSLSSLICEFGGAGAENDAYGVSSEEDEWPRYAFKLATGAGKTKCMSLAIVWSYFHALRESGSDMARHFLVIAPNLTVFERLKEDFRPEGGGPDIFLKDPLIPPEWRGDWNFSVILQDEAGGATTGGALYLTNVHRLFEERRSGRRDAETHPWAGPSVSRASALDTGAKLRERITSHRRVMLLNDEAHHVWDPGSAWSGAIRALHRALASRAGGLVAQMDFSATPKDNKGYFFPHVVCDTPLGEAVDAGIVKTPIIGRTPDLVEQPHEDAAYRYEAHLRLGYERWRHSRNEWAKSGKRPLLFVMCEDTKAADDITRRLNGDAIFKELNGKTINLHTNLKGRIRNKEVGGQKIRVFEESERQISDEDLKALRRISRELDSDESRYACIVSVLMLREGWDVRNVTTIVPLRPYSAQANILPEQTLGRGLRRMTPPGTGGADELVVVVEHPAFTSLYKEQLEQEGLPIGETDADKVPATTVSIFPDEHKDGDALDVVLPALTAAHKIQPTLENLSVQDVRNAAAPLRSLPLGRGEAREVKYEGRHLFTDEVVERMEVRLELLANGFTAISFYVLELEIACKVRSTHAVLAPLLEVFLGEILFGEKVSLTNPRLTARLADQDVREHIRAVFVPLIRARTTRTKKRRAGGGGTSLRDWKPYQATSSERRPVVRADKTLFNLTPCNQSLEVAMTAFLDAAPDVAAFAKNAGPQALRIDYLTRAQRLAFYTPDFFVRMEDGAHYLVETKGRQDADVSRKARAAMEWCRAAASSGVKWEYVFTPQNVMERLTSNRFDALVRSCAPALQNLLSEATDAPELPFFAREETDAESFFSAETFGRLGERERRAATDALELYRFFERKKDAPNLSPVFTALLGPLDDACKAMILIRLCDKVPTNRHEQEAWFDPHWGNIDERARAHYREMAKKLKRGLLYGNPFSVIGLLRSCLDYALKDDPKLDGVFAAARGAFRSLPEANKLLERIAKVNNFRNEYVAHSSKRLTDKARAERNLKLWVETLASLRA